MNDLERTQLLALRAQLVAGVAQVDALLGVGTGETGAGANGCAHPPECVKQFGGGFGEGREITKICSLCGDTVT